MIELLNTAELIKEITGVQMPEKENPFFHHSQHSEDGYITFCISELTADFVHQGGTMVIEGDSPRRAGDFHIHRVVDYPDKGVFNYWLSKAAEDAGYEASIVGWFDVTTNVNHAQKLQEAVDDHNSILGRLAQTKECGL